MWRSASCLPLLLVATCSIEPSRTNGKPGEVPEPRVAEAFDHSRLDKVLREHVSDEGVVDYPGLAADRADLDAYLESLATVVPDELGSKNERMAYWINAYNAITLAGVLRFYPTASVKDHPGFWDKIYTNCGGRDVTLNQIEHEILRPMGDPRVHMAINCASKSCPRLRNRAYSGIRLQEQLDEASRDFLASRDRNRLDADEEIAYLSMIFSWFGRDFDVAPYHGVRGFVRRYAIPMEWLRGSFTIRYLRYDWSLNGPVAGG